MFKYLVVADKPIRKCREIIFCNRRDLCLNDRKFYMDRNVQKHACTHEDTKQEENNERKKKKNIYKKEKYGKINRDVLAFFSLARENDPHGIMGTRKAEMKSVSKEINMA